MLEEPARIYGEQPPLMVDADGCTLALAVVSAAHLELTGTVTVDGVPYPVDATAVRVEDGWSVDAVAAGLPRPALERVARAVADTTASPARKREIYERAAANRDAMADGLRALHAIAARHAAEQEALARVLAPESPRQLRALVQAKHRRAQATHLAVRIENLGGTVTA